MLRSIGIPAREAVGYVPGPYNPITDLYEVQAKDAHAWVQVWFPGYGWQSFDPTASVPLANPTPGVTLLHDIAHTLARLPWVGIGVALGILAMAMVALRWLRRRPRSWAEQVARRIERAGRAAGRRRLPNETLAEYAGALDRVAGDRSGTWQTLADMAEASAYGGRDRPPTAAAGRCGRSRAARRHTSSGTGQATFPGWGGTSSLPRGPRRRRRPSGRPVGERLVEGGARLEQRAVAHQLARTAEPDGRG